MYRDLDRPDQGDERAGATIGNRRASAFQGVAMHWDNEPGSNQPGVYLIDD